MFRDFQDPEMPSTPGPEPAARLLADFRRRFCAGDGPLEEPEVAAMLEVPGGWEMTVSRPEYLSGSCCLFHLLEGGSC